MRQGLARHDRARRTHPRHWRGQAKKWIYPKIGATKLKEFNATDADRFFKELGKVLSKRR